MPEQKRILLAVWQFLNRVYPFMALAHALRRRGHDVAFYTAEAVRPIVEGEGFRCFTFREVKESQVDDVVSNLIAESAGRRRSRKLRKLWHQYLLGTLPGQLADLSGVLKAWPADAIVCDVAMWGPILVLHETGGPPVALFPHLAYSLLPGPDAGIPGVRFSRSKTFPVPIIRRLLSKIVSVITGGVPRDANRIRERYGLPPLDVTVNEYSGRLPLYLIPGPAEFDFNRQDLPATVHYIGVAAWDKNMLQQSPAWLASVDRSRPVVLVIEEAVFPKDPAMLKMAAGALADQPLTALLIAGQGRPQTDLDLGPLSSNVVLHPHAPLSDLLPAASIVVTNGNSPTVMATLAAGIPLVVVPSIFDQNDVAWRVQDLSLGLRVSPRSAPEQLRAAVERVLREPAFRGRAKEFSRAISRSGGADAGAELVEQLASGKLTE